MNEAKLKVNLLSYTENAEKLIAAAARLCYSPAGIDEVMESIDELEGKRFVNMLFELGHESPIEHVSFTFGIEGVSRSLLAQLTRHRIASYSVKSQRYVNEGNFDFVIPPEIARISEAKEVFLKAMEEDNKRYKQLTDLLFKEHLKNYLEKGYSDNIAKRMAEKKAIEDARFVLPNACETRLIVTMNARSLFNFFHHRCCNRAQWEIRNLAEEMLKSVKKVAPILFKFAGPKCLIGPCPEGKMSCGEIEKVRNKFLTIGGTLNETD